MTLVHSHCGSLFATSLDQASQDADKFTRGPMDGASGRAHRVQTFDVRSNQDTTSSDGESVGPTDSPDLIEPEVADLLCAAVQEMELLARNCLLVEESYQRYFLRNCGTQKEEAVWRQQGIREEALARQATKAVSQIHINELWARVGYYNNEAAQRSNLFRMLLLEKRKLDIDGRTEVKENSGAAKTSDKRRRRPTGFCLDGVAALEIKGNLVTLKAEESSPVKPVVATSSSSSLFRTALVHNPYSFDGPSQVTVNAAQEPEEKPSCSAASATSCPQVTAASTPAMGGMGAVLKRLAPDHRPPPPDIAKVLLQFPPPAPRPTTRATSAADAPKLQPKLQLHPMLQGFLGKGVAGRAPSTSQPPSGAEDCPGDHPSSSEVSKSAPLLLPEPLPEAVPELERLEPELPKADALPLPSQTIPNCVVMEGGNFPAGKSPIVPETLAQLMEEVTGQLAEQEADIKPPKRRATQPGDEAGEDHGGVASFPTCSHIKFWKRLRANRGFAYFLCYQCGAKWRMTSKGMRHPAAAAATAPHRGPLSLAAEECPTASPGVGE